MEGRRVKVEKGQAFMDVLFSFKKKIKEGSLLGQTWKIATVTFDFDDLDLYVADNVPCFQCVSMNQTQQSNACDYSRKERCGAGCDITKGFHFFISSLSSSLLLLLVLVRSTISLVVIVVTLLLCFTLL